MNQTFSKPHAVLAGLSLLFLSLSLLTACQQQAAKTTGEKIVVRDTSITKTNAYSDLFFDSAQLETVMQQRGLPDTIAQQLRQFYRGRNYEYAWFNSTGLTEQADLFWNLQSEYVSYSRDSALYNPLLQQLMDSARATDGTLTLPDTTRLMAELQLTGQFARYARRAYQGNVALNNDLNWFIPRKRLNTVALLDSFLKTKEAYEPVNVQYGLLKKFLLRYHQMQRQGGWPAINSTQKKFTAGDSSAAISAIKKRLFTTGDFTQPDSSTVFTDSLKAAVKRFQKRYGLAEDGVVGGRTLTKLNEPIEQSTLR